MKAQQESKVIFKNKFIEQLSKTNCYTVVVFFLISALVIASIGSYNLSVPILYQLSTIIIGLLFFSLFEYLVHRYLFHTEGADDKNNWTYLLHNIHHDHPRDKRRLALPLPLGIIFGSLLYIIFWLILKTFTPFFFAGFITGYAMYLLIHFWIHTRKPPKNIFKALWKNHHIHHYKDHTKAYGVTSPLWDVVFKTMP